MKITAKDIATFIEQQRALERELEQLLDGKKLDLDSIVLTQALSLAATIENQEDTSNPQVLVYARHLPALLLAQQVDILRQTLVQLRADEPVSFAGQALGDVPETWRDHLAAAEHEIAALQRENARLREQLGLAPTERASSAEFDVEFPTPDTEAVQRIAALEEELEHARATIENQKTQLSLAQAHYEQLTKQLKIQ